MNVVPARICYKYYNFMNWLISPYLRCNFNTFKQTAHSFTHTGLRSAVGNVSGNRCESAADPGVLSSIPAGSHTFLEIDHKIISTVILLPSADSF